VSYELLVDEHGRIAARHENVAGTETYFTYEYDAAGHLLRVWRNGKLAEEYAYDGRGARAASWNPRQGQWAYAYDQRGRLASAGPWKFAYADDGSLREAWTPRLSYHFAANQAEGLTRIVLPGGRVLRSETLAPGLPVEKYVDAVPVESLTWRSPLQLAIYRDRQRGVHMQFHYAGSERLPQAVTVQDGSGSTSYLLGYDQVGSLKAAAAMDGPQEGRVVKLIDYDAFGNILSDSNPNLFLPLAFAGGLRDRFTGLVRFLHRDYDPTVGRFTAPDPLGDTGGDHDPYDYCVDEPVGRVDPEGLKEETTDVSSSPSQGISSKPNFLVDLFAKVGGAVSDFFTLYKVNKIADKAYQNATGHKDGLIRGMNAGDIKTIEKAHEDHRGILKNTLLMQEKRVLKEPTNPLGGAKCPAWHLNYYEKTTAIYNNFCTIIFYFCQPIPISISFT